MKKRVFVCFTILALLLTLLFAQASSVYQTWTYEDAGISVQIPAALLSSNVSSENGFGLQITDPLEPNIVYYYTAIYKEEYEGQWMEDIPAYQYEALIEYLVGPGEYAYDTLVEENRTYLVASLSGGVQLHYVLLLNGWFLTASASVPEGYTVGDAAVDDLVEIIRNVTLHE